MKFFSGLLTCAAFTATLVSAVPVDGGDALAARAPPNPALASNLINSLNLVGQATGTVIGSLANFNSASTMGQAYTIVNQLNGLDRGLRNANDNAMRIPPGLDYATAVRVVSTLQRTMPGIGDLLNKSIPAKNNAFRTFPVVSGQVTQVQNSIRSDAILVLNTIQARVPQPLKTQIQGLKDQLQRRLV
ncbi:hypothetical protein BDN72DRAFT_128874 [Pluteus cervinus]|uniref:Uncharacterized protein n=1 Tax=Pluteus cervinus TaxID=181527 RepID=A0ACD3AMA6_9AGAR|nr:hypothetical protein BDN72DRAFT_128874 [Pluteus cervinus]